MWLFKRKNKSGYEGEEALRAEEILQSDEASQREDSVRDIVNQVVAFATSPENVAVLNMLERDTSADSRERYIKEMREHVRSVYRLSEEMENLVIEEFSRFMWSYYIIDELIANPDISDIHILGHDQIYYKEDGVRKSSSIHFSDEKDYERFVERVAIKNKVNTSDKNAIQRFTDKSQPGWRLRFTLSTKFVTNTRTAFIHIRKHPAVKYDIPYLIGKKMLTESQAEYLKDKMRQGESILFSGSGGSGKTTLLNALMEYIPDKSIYCIQETDELFMEKKALFMTYHTVENKGEGKISYSLSDLAENGLTTDTDVFIVGEIKGAEALDFLIAVHTGATGYGSVHAPSERDAFVRLVDYIKKASDYNVNEIQYMLRFLNTVVFMQGYKVGSISTVSWDNEKDKLRFTKEVM